MRVYRWFLYILTVVWLFWLSYGRPPYSCLLEWKALWAENTCLTELMPKLWGLTRFLCFGVSSLSLSAEVWICSKNRTDILCTASERRLMPWGFLCVLWFVCSMVWKPPTFWSYIALSFYLFCGWNDWVDDSTSSLSVQMTISWLQNEPVVFCVFSFVSWALSWGVFLSPQPSHIAHSSPYLCRHR